MRGRSDRARGKELEFLPATLEVQESPPSPIARAISMTIIAAFIFAVIWASVGKVEVVALARGKIIPSDRSKIIQPLESGIIRAIRVRDGQAVRKGDLLIELDPTTGSADLQRLTSEYLSAKVEVERLRALMAGRVTLEAPSGADPKLVALQGERLRSQWAEHRARLESVRQLIEQRKAAREATKASIQGLQAIVPMVTERAEAYKKLLEQEYVARMQYLEAEEKRIDKVQELAAQRQKLVQDTAALAEVEEQLRVIESEFDRARLAELAEVETRAASLQQEVVKASQRVAIHRLTAPIDGVVQQLAVNTVGGVVMPAQQLMVIVPTKDYPEIEAWIENKDIGFVNPEQSVEVKIDTFPFTRYGTIKGTVTTVSRDAVSMEKVGFVYPARVSLERYTIQVEDKPVSLVPGMAVTVEIQTSQRRLIEFFASPLLRYRQESLRER